MHRALPLALAALALASCDTTTVPVRVEGRYTGTFPPVADGENRAQVDAAEGPGGALAGTVTLSFVATDGTITPLGTAPMSGQHTADSATLYIMFAPDFVSEYRAHVRGDGATLAGTWRDPDGNTFALTLRRD